MKKHLIHILLNVEVPAPTKREAMQIARDEARDIKQNMEPGTSTSTVRCRSWRVLDPIDPAPGSSSAPG